MDNRTALLIRRCCGIAALALGVCGWQQAAAATLSRLDGTLQPRIRFATDAGRAAAGTLISGMTLELNLTAAQQRDLDALLVAQQDPNSPQYHAWLTPAQFESRFGASPQRLQRIAGWLQAQGFIVDSVEPGRRLIRFSGKVATVEAAFRTQVRLYLSHGVLHRANAEALAVPSSWADEVGGVGHLAEFRPRARSFIPAQPQFTSGITQDHYLAPGDIATIYGVNPMYSAGYTGSGRTIAVVGQSAIKTSDIAAFRSAAGLPANPPQLLLVPGTGLSVRSTQDEIESDLDIEWAGGVARDATILFVYSGASLSHSVFDALQYAVQNNLAPIVSVSYGLCENSLSGSSRKSMESIFAQAAAQGQTIIAASGDAGAADCDSAGSKTVTSASKGLAVDYPASSPNVTGIGGTTFDEGALSASYWGAANDSNNASALSYIPETAWNDTSSGYGLASSGGGASTLFAKPSWQTGTGVPADGARDVPDIALAASVAHDAYLYCNEGSCSNGFRDSSNALTAAGGTSFGAPVFSGMLTLITQSLGTDRLGNINSHLYELAASAPQAFHDVTTGNNQQPCNSGTPDCGGSGVLGYSAGAGYDPVTGLGSIDVQALADAWGPVTSFTPNSSTGSGSSSGGTGSTGGSSGSGGGGGGGAPSPALLVMLSALLALKRWRD
jgi:subtilase family serine protease